jgi:hypothetical protein
MEPGAFTAAAAQAGIFGMGERRSAEIPTFKKQRTDPAFTDIPLRPPVASNLGSRLIQQLSKCSFTELVLVEVT